VLTVLGIDPGTASTGWGAVVADGSRLRAAGSGTIRTPAGQALEGRLSTIFREVDALIRSHAPDAIALEDLYVGGNPRTVLSVGHARGAVLAAGGLAGVTAFGYPPADVKATVCGFGRAGKEQVTRMVGAILAMEAAPDSDHAADALAVAVCHALRARAPGRAPRGDAIDGARA
jgi:crossover junction endodeoxyribonuclease RuvC